MCCTFEEAKLSNTLIYVGEGTRDGKYVHVLAYQNNAESKTNKPNAMVLPFPTSVKMDENKIIDTRKFSSFLKDIERSTRMHAYRRSLSSDNMKGLRSDDYDALVFDVGSYTIVLAEDVNQIPKALQRVPENKRPNVSDEFLNGYGNLYYNQPIAVCCWNGSIEAEPLLWWYEPTNRDVLFAPTVDAHDGKAPNLKAKVKTDHLISVGSSNSDRVGKHFRIYYSNKFPSEISQLLPEYAYSTKLDYEAINSDMFADPNKLGKNKEFKSLPKISRGNSEIEMFGWL